jgi:hypothetical protein|tara:strand:+ start:163 stop:543 length:381 start_codon:yes stop_codon:yes gene_type:complete
MDIGLKSRYQRRVDTRVIKGGKRILMSCGGGMGGSKWYHEVTDIDMDGEFIEAICISGQNLTLGKQFVVKIIDVDFHGQVLEAEDGTKTLEWYDVPKGAKFEYTNDERHDAAYMRKPCYTKELING